MRATALAAIAVLSLARPALADGPIATAGASGPAAPQPTEAPPSLPAAEAAPVEDQPVAIGPCGPERVRPDGKLETAPHGEIEVGVGTGGYRHVAGAVCQPIGQRGAVAVGVSATQASPAYRRR